MATLIQIRDQLIIDANVLGDPMFQKARLNRIINEAQYYVQKELANLGIKGWEDSDSPAISAAVFGSYGNNTWSFTLASMKSNVPDYLECKHPILYINLTCLTAEMLAFAIAREVEPKRFLDMIQNTYLSPGWTVGSSKNEAIFTIADNVVYISPYVIASQTSLTAKVFYRKRVAELTTDAGVSEIPNEFIPLVIQKGIVDIKEIKKELNDKQIAMAELKSDITSTFEKYKGQTIETEEDNEVLQ